MRFALVGLTACWTGPVAAPVAPAERPGRCAIQEVDVPISGLAKLSIEGLEFANVSGPLMRLGVTFRGVVARARVESEEVVLEGDLDLTAISLRPREPGLRDGWIEVRSATAKAATETNLRVEVALPDGLAPKTTTFMYPCHTLTFAVAPDPAEDTGEEAEPLELVIGTQLRPTPAGQPVARVTGQRQDDKLVSVQALVLDKRGTMTQVRIDGENPVVVWVPSGALQQPTNDLLGGFGYGHSGFGRHQYHCERDTPIYVRVGGRVVRVGKIKKGAGFYLDSKSKAEDGEHAIDLGVTKPGTVPFLKQAEFSRCG
jgi:hypothetical protein